MARPRTAHHRGAAVEVLHLSQEIAGLRRGQRSRAVIEQAKGVLMARLDCSSEQAFEQLTRISQETNTKVAEVAAGLLNLTAPIGSGSAGEVPALPDQDAARYHLTCAAMAAAGSGNAVAEALLGEGLRPLGAAAVLLAVREPDGTVALAGSHGLPRGLVSSWQRVPAGLKVGFLAAAGDGRPLWLDRAEAHRAGLQLLGDYDFRACLPLRRANETFGVAMVLWTDNPGLDLTDRAFVSALTAAAGRRLSQLASAEPTPVGAAAAHWLEAVLEALPGSFALLRPISDQAGTVVDWRFDKCSPQARDALGHTGDELVGRRLLELHPQLAGGDLLRGYEQVLRTGRPFTHGPVRESLAVLGRSAHTTIWIRASRLGDGILVTWRHDDQQTVLQERIRFLQQVAPAGWARWNLQTGEVEWAPENAAVLRQPGPVAIGDLPDCAAPADRDRLAEALLEVMQEHTSVDLTVRTADDPGADAIRVALEPVVESHGRLTAVVAAFACDATAAQHEPAGPRPKPPAGGRTKSTRSPDERSLAGAVRELRDDVRRLRAEQETTAVIERAKGMVAARLGCSVEAALDHLTGVAQRRGLRLVEVAAGVVGTATPPGWTATPAPAAFRPETYLGQPGLPGPTHECAAPVTSQTPTTWIAAELQAATDGDGVAASLWRAGLRPKGAAAVVLGVLEPDGAVRLVGSYGLPAQLAGAWCRTPSSLNVAYLRAVATDQTLWISRDEAGRKGYELLGEGEFRACVPLHQGGRTFGVASVLWAEPPGLSEAARAEIVELVEAAGQRLSELLRADPRRLAASPAAHWAETIIGALPAGYALLRPVRDRVGAVVDWAYEICSPGTADVEGRTAEALVGRRLRRLYPHLLSTGIAQAYQAALETGGAADWGPTEFDVDTAQGPVTVTMSGRASKFGDGILISWRREEQDQLGGRLRLLEHATASGWAEWNLNAGETVWSETVYEMLRRDPRRGPVRLGALHRYVVTEDEVSMTEAVRRVTRLGRDVDIVIRVRRHGDVTPIRFAARPVIDEHRQVAAVRALFQYRPPA